MQIVKLKYDGVWPGLPQMGRQWTIVSDYYDADGQNRKWGSFSLEGLAEIGVIPPAKEIK